MVDADAASRGRAEGKVSPAPRTPQVRHRRPACRARKRGQGEASWRSVAWWRSVTRVTGESIPPSLRRPPIRDPRPSLAARPPQEEVADARSSGLNAARGTVGEHHPGCKRPWHRPCHEYQGRHDGSDHVPYCRRGDGSVRLGAVTLDHMVENPGHQAHLRGLVWPRGLGSSRGQRRLTSQTEGQREGVFVRWFGLRRRGAFAALVQAGWFEAILAAVLAVVCVGLLVGMGRAWQGVALDLLICAVAAGTGRWPRVTAVALAVVMVAYLLIPRSWTTMGEYAPFIPILGSGMRGATRLRALMTIGYFPLSVGRIFALAAPDQASAIAGSLLWAVLIAILWLIGNAFTAVIEAQRKARAAELGLMRQELTRELHDTVARSLTRVTLAAERARLRGGASEDDLALISDTAADGIRQLRWVMSLLASPVEPGALSRLPGTSLNLSLIHI